MWLFYGILASAIWASGDDVNSLLVKRYEKNPILLSWFQSVVGLVILTMFAMAFDVRSQHVPLLILGGIIAYGGYLFFLHVLQHVDVSVSTAAWAMLAIFMSIAGFLLFGDRWSLLQGVGVALVLLGVFILAYWYQHVSVPRTLAMFSILGLLYVPFYVAQKTALIAGDPVTAVFFWPLFAELVCAFTLPWCIPMYRRNLLAFHPQVSRGFLLHPCQFDWFLCIHQSVPAWYGITCCYDRECNALLCDSLCLAHCESCSQLRSP